MKNWKQFNENSSFGINAEYDDKIEIIDIRGSWYEIEDWDEEEFVDHIKKIIKKGDNILILDPYKENSPECILILKDDLEIYSDCWSDDMDNDNINSDSRWFLKIEDGKYISGPAEPQVGDMKDDGLNGIINGLQNSLGLKDIKEFTDLMEKYNIRYVIMHS